jgi:hypothetical protein
VFDRREVVERYTFWPSGMVEFFVEEKAEAESVELGKEKKSKLIVECNEITFQILYKDQHQSAFREKKNTYSSI